MTARKENEQTPEQQAMEDLVNRCRIFTIRYGETLGKSGSPGFLNLTMKYEGKGLTIRLNTNAPAKSQNHSFQVFVKEGDTVVLDASGNCRAWETSIAVRTYVPGDWEKKIPAQPAR